MEFIFPMRLGFKPLSADKLEKRSDWCGVMLEGFSFTKIMNDDRATSIEALMTNSSKIPTLVANKDRLIQLKAIFLYGSNIYDEQSYNEATDPAKFLEAFPGLQRIYIKQGMGMSGHPLRHIGLEYLGLPVESLMDKRLYELVLPNLRILTLRGFSSEPELIEQILEDLLLTATGQLFPRLERLYIGHCPFINQVINKLFVQNQEPIQLQQIDLMDSYELDSNEHQSESAYDYESWHRRSLQDLTPVAKSELADHLEITTNAPVPDDVVELFGGRLRTGVGLVPY